MPTQKSLHMADELLRFKLATIFYLLDIVEEKRPSQPFSGSNSKLNAAAERYARSRLPNFVRSNARKRGTPTIAVTTPIGRVALPTSRPVAQPARRMVN